MTDHVEELAELYALGALDDLEGARVRRHAASCQECTKRISDAENAVAALAEDRAVPLRPVPESLSRRLQTSIERGRRTPFFDKYRTFAATAAAAAVCTFLPTWLILHGAAPQSMSQDERALARIAASGTQVAHAQFMATPSKAMDAKVLYGPHGDWYYIVVMHPHAGMHVAYVHGGRMEMLGDVAMHGESGTLYLPVNHKMDELALLDGTRVVADAHLAYQE
jgi:hypothetical protein